MCLASVLRLAALLIAASLTGRAPAAALEGSAGSPTQAGAYDRSLALARAALARRPRDVRLLQVIADIHFRQGKFSEAIGAYEELLKVEPGFTDAIFGIAESHAQLEHQAPAIEWYQKCTRDASPAVRARAWKGLGEVYFRAANYAESATAYRETLNLGDRNPDTRYQLARALDCQSRAARLGTGADPAAARLDAEAQAELEAVLAAAPTHAPAWYLLSTLHRRQGKNDEARRDLEQFQQHRKKAAAVEAEAAARSERTFEAKTAVQIARAHFAAQDGAAALEMARRARQVDPELTEAALFEAWILKHARRTAEAAQIYDQVIVAEPENAEASWNLATIRLGEGRADLAAPLALRSAEARKVFPEAWELLRKIALEQGIFGERVEEFARNALRDRPSRDNHLELASILFHAGKEAQCREVLELGLRRYPGDAQLDGALRAVREKSK